ncbi:acyl-ACP thioesterase [Tissierella creatinini]|nr:acyl-ACP thioesterase [Tissierella creatinini]TJX61520.1 acyl-ACP thioesterase [Soehngenia saccharolytica]
MSKYRKKFIIPYYDGDKDGYIRPENLLAYLGETSNLHSDSIGLGLKELKSSNYCWILNRWRARFFKHPRVRDEITIETWCSGIDKFYASREFAVYDKDEDIIFKGSTQWVFLDLNKGRPVRVPEEVGKPYGECKDKLLEDFYDFRKDYEVEKGLEFHVRRSDIDSNKHVNNVKYLNWILEAVPDDIVDKHRLYDLDIFYKKEVKQGNTIESSILQDVKELNPTFLHKITNEKEIHALGRTLWK